MSERQIEFETYRTKFMGKFATLGNIELVIKLRLIYN